MAKKDKRLELLKLVDESHGPVGAACLSEKLGVPPATVGRLLARLEGEGLLLKVSNRGRVVTEEGKVYLSSMSMRSSKLAVADKLINLVQDVSKQRLFEVLEVRKLLEVKTVELAAQRATPDKVQVLEDILFDHIYEVKHGGLGSEADLRLHLCIAKLSGNDTIYQILKLLLKEDNVYTRFSAAADLLTGGQIQQHRDIVDAVRAGDVPRARQAMTHHLDKVIGDVEMYY